MGKSIYDETIIKRFDQDHPDDELVLITKASIMKSRDIDQRELSNTISSLERQLQEKQERITNYENSMKQREADLR